MRPPKTPHAAVAAPTPTKRAASAARRKLTVAVTGPTGQIGRPFMAALERAPQVGRVIGMARRPFDPTRYGWKKLEYRQGDIRDRDALDALVAGADVVAHLAFIVFAGRGASREINLAGSRNVFQAAVAANAKRLLYTSSVAAYGFHDDAPALLTEDVPARGTERLPYSAQKAEVETELAQALAGSDTEAFVMRPCIVAGPHARGLVQSIPLIDLGGRLPGLRTVSARVPMLKPLLPDPGVPFQLVHEDDLAAALCAAVLGRGKPGVYNLAGPGEITASDLAHELGWYAVPVPKLAVDATAEIVARLVFLPNEASWIEACRRPVLMDTTHARRELHWRPQRDARETLRQTVAAWRGKSATVVGP